MDCIKNDEAGKILTNSTIRSITIEKNTTLKEESNSLAKDDDLFEEDEEKPLWRGKVHRLAFYYTVGLFFLFLFFFQTDRIFLTMYFLSQMILYGVSSIYHMTDWKSKSKERIFQKLDHVSIFLLISGTQLCVFKAITQIVDIRKSIIIEYMYVTYTIAALGVVKVFFFWNIPRYVNVFYYIIHGTSVAAYLPLNALVKEKAILTFCFLGGITYIIGGAVYGTKKPNPSPKIFGYHEVFHVLTVGANLCFLLAFIWANYKKE